MATALSIGKNKSKQFPSLNHNKNHQKSLKLDYQCSFNQNLHCDKENNPPDLIQRNLCITNQSINRSITKNLDKVNKKSGSPQLSPISKLSSASPSQPEYGFQNLDNVLPFSVNSNKAAKPTSILQETIINDLKQNNFVNGHDDKIEEKNEPFLCIQSKVSKNYTQTLENPSWRENTAEFLFDNDNYLQENLSARFGGMSSSRGADYFLYDEKNDQNNLKNLEMLHKIPNENTYLYKANEIIYDTLNQSFSKNTNNDSILITEFPHNFLNIQNKMDDPNYLTGLHYNLGEQEKKNCLYQFENSNFIPKDKPDSFFKEYSSSAIQKNLTVDPGSLEAANYNFTLNNMPLATSGFERSLNYYIDIIGKGEPCKEADKMNKDIKHDNSFQLESTKICNQSCNFSQTIDNINNLPNPSESLAKEDNQETSLVLNDLSSVSHPEIPAYLNKNQDGKGQQKIGKNSHKKPLKKSKKLQTEKLKTRNCKIQTIISKSEQSTQTDEIDGILYSSTRAIINFSTFQAMNFFPQIQPKQLVCYGSIPPHTNRSASQRFLVNSIISQENVDTLTNLLSPATARSGAHNQYTLIPFSNENPFEYENNPDNNTITERNASCNDQDKHIKEYQIFQEYNCQNKIDTIIKSQKNDIHNDIVGANNFNNSSLTGADQESFQKPKDKISYQPDTNSCITSEIQLQEKKDSHNLEEKKQSLLAESIAFSLSNKKINLSHNSNEEILNQNNEEIIKTRITALNSSVLSISNSNCQKTSNTPIAQNVNNKAVVQNISNASVSQNNTVLIDQNAKHTLSLCSNTEFLPKFTTSVKPEDPGILFGKNGKTKEELIKLRKELLHSKYHKRTKSALVIEKKKMEVQQTNNGIEEKTTVLKKEIIDSIKYPQNNTIMINKVKNKIIKSFNK